MMKSIGSGVAASAALLWLTTVASATALSPGQSGVAVGPEGGTYVLLYSSTQSFNFAGNAGSVVADVVNWGGSPFGAGDISFFFQVTVTAGHVDHLSDGNLAGAGVLIDVGQTGNVSGANLVTGNAPAQSADMSLDGSTVEFDFPGANAITSASGPSYLVIINTNQTTWSFGSLGLIDDGRDTLQGFGVAPEPASMALALAGLPCLAIGRWLKRRK